MNDILNKKSYNYDTNKIFKIIKKYNIDVYNKIILTEKNTYERPHKNYKRQILDNIVKAESNIKAPFYKRASKTRNNKKDLHNIFFDDQMNRLVIEFFYCSKILN
jgi:hypothetical protein